MTQSQKSLVGYAAVMLGAVAVVAVVMRLTQGEVGFCRETLGNLVNDRQSAQRQIDWEHLQAVGLDVGKTYTQLPDEPARAQYRKAFVDNFAMGFRRVEGNLAAFRNWRVQTRDGSRIVVAAEYEAKHKTLLFSLPAVGDKKIEAIQWQ